jgi:hypothetical protein
MSYERTEIGTLVKSDPASAAEALVKLFESARGNTVHAALLAGVDHSTLKRWVTKLDEYKVRAKLEKIRKGTRPKSMSDDQRTKLTERAQERRRVAGLQRAYDRLDEDGAVKLAVEVSVTPKVLDNWRYRRATLDDTTVEAVDEALGRMLARYRAQLRSANRAKKAG